MPLSVPSAGRAAQLELFAEELLGLLQLAHRLQQAGQVAHGVHRIRVGVATLRPASAPAIRGIERSICVVESLLTSTGLHTKSWSNAPRRCIWRQNIYKVWWGGPGNRIIVSVPTAAKTERNGMPLHHDPNSKTSTPGLGARSHHATSITGWTRRSNAPLYRAKCFSSKLTGMVCPYQESLPTRDQVLVPQLLQDPRSTANPASIGKPMKLTVFAARLGKPMTQRPDSTLTPHAD